jgi:hypothetical protein
VLGPSRHVDAPLDPEMAGLETCIAIGRDESESIEGD